MHSTMKRRLFTWFLIVSVVPLLIIGGISYYFISNEISKQTEERVMDINTGIKNMVDTQQKVLYLWLESAAVSFNYKLETLGESRFDYNEMVNLAGHHMPTWYIGNQKVSNDYTLVDSLTGQENLQATMLMLHNNEFVRVSTSVRQEDGTRIMDTVIKSGPVYDTIINGKRYLGRASVEGIWESTLYEPIFNKDGQLIGAFVLGRKEKEYEMISAIKKISIGESGYVFVNDSKGDVIIHPFMDGQNIIDYPWIQEIIKNKEGKVRYSFSDQDKIVYYTYYEPWDWYIVTGGNENEIFSTRNKLYNIVLLALITVALIALFIAYFLSKSFSKPLEELMGVMKETQDGDFSSKLKCVNNDEFGVLNIAFNNMLSNISILIGKILFNSSNLKDASKMLKADIKQSREALKGIEQGVEGLKAYDCSEQRDMSHYINNDYNEMLLNQINELRFQLDEVIVTKDYSSLENIKLEFNELEELVLGLDNIEGNVNEEGNLLDHPISYENKIDNLNVEVQKLKILLENISASGDTLDDVAIALDNHINIFKIDQGDK